VERMIMSPVEAMKLDVEKKCEAEIQAVLQKHGCTFSVLQTYENGKLIGQGVRVIMISAAVSDLTLPPAGNGGGEKQ